MFLGQTVNLIDEKNRLVLPTRYREELGYSFASHSTLQKFIKRKLRRSIL